MRKFLQTIVQTLGGSPASSAAAGAGTRQSAVARVVPREQHSVSRADISEHALKVLYRLRKAGYQSYLVGGGVRDLLLRQTPKDFDIATEASPEQVRKVFSNCRLIGRRFRLAHVHFGRDVIEVATFRGVSDDDDAAGVVRNDQGRLLRDNVYGTVEEDAWRRDFTINALYYSIEDFAIHDFVGGMEDLERGVIRLIGKVDKRYREDPVRMLRAVRFAARLDFTIDKATAQGIRKHRALLAEIAPARLFDECLKLFMSGYGRATLELLRDYDLLEPLFPDTERVLREEGDEGPSLKLLRQAMDNTDQRVREGRPVTPAFLFAALLWAPVRQQQYAMAADGVPPAEALQRASSYEVMRELERVALPRRFKLPMREIWQLQSRFERRRGKRVWQFLGHPRFRAAYDFMLLRALVGEVPQELADWWTRVQEVDRGEQERMIAASPGQAPPPNTAGVPGRRRRRRGGRRRNATRE